MHHPDSPSARIVCRGAGCRALRASLAFVAQPFLAVRLTGVAAGFSPPSSPPPSNPASIAQTSSPPRVIPSAARDLLFDVGRAACRSSPSSILHITISLSLHTRMCKIDRRAIMPTNLAIDDRLITEAQKLGRHRTKKDAVTAALDEYIQRRKQQDILPLFGTIEYDRNYDYKKERTRKRS